MDEKDITEIIIKDTCKIAMCQVKKTPETDEASNRETQCGYRSFPEISGMIFQE